MERRVEEHELSAVPREARAFQGQPAGVVTRFVAATVDVGVVAVVLLLAYLGWAGLSFLIDPRGFTFPDLKPFTSLLACAVVLWSYLTVAWAINGRTYGNLLMGLRVVGPQKGVGVVRAAARAALYVVLPIGLLWVAIDQHHRSVQDIIVRTAVTYDWHTGAPRVRPDHPSPSLT
jgi:hypothetical protein